MGTLTVRGSACGAMVRLKLPPQRRQLATGGNNDDEDASAVILQAEQEARDAVARAVAATEGGAQAVPSARSALSIFEAAIEELGPPIPPDKMPVLATVSDARSSARRLVCRDSETTKNPNTWDSFINHSKSLVATKQTRRARRPKGIWPRTEKKTQSAETTAEAHMAMWAKRFAADIRPPTREDFSKEEQKYIDRNMPGQYVTTSLPSYRCMARSLTEDEAQQLEENRKKIKEVREREDGDHRHFGTSFRWKDKEEDELANLAQVIGPPMYTEPRSKGAGRVTTENLKAFRSEYEDFMDEERRDILSTIRGTTARLGRNEVSLQELEEQERLDALAEYASRFENEERDDLVLSKRKLVTVVDENNEGKTKERIVCHNTPLTNFDNPDARDPQKETTNGGEAAVVEREKRDEDWVNARKVLLKEDGKMDKTGKKGEAKGKGGMGVIVDKKVEKLMDENDCEPCKDWEFPTEGPKAGNGYYQAIRRVLEVQKQLGSQKGNPAPGETTLEWAYFDTFKQDPFVRYFTGMGTSQSGRTYLVMQLWRQYNQHAPNQKSYNWTMLQIDMLRCFPEKMPADGTRLNSILAFTCWWDKNITRDDLNAYTTRDEKTAKKDTNKLRVDRIYRALCCPNCRPQRFGLNEPDSLFALRRAVHTRIGNLRIFMEGLKEALDKDVLNGEKKDSILWNYKADTDPAANAVVRKELYEGWKLLNPLQ